MSGKLKLYIVGSCRDEGRIAAFRQACEELGEALARYGHSLIVGSNSEKVADRWVVVGANQVQGPKHQVDIFRADQTGARPFGNEVADFPQIHFRWLGGSTQWPKVHTDAVKAADAVIVVGGRHGSHVAAITASLMGKRVIPIAAFGGAGEELFNDLSKTYLEAGFDEDTLAGLNRPWDSEVPQSVLHALEQPFQPSRETLAIDPSSLTLGYIWSKLSVRQAYSLIGVLAFAISSIFSAGWKAHDFFSAHSPEPIAKTLTLREEMLEGNPGHTSAQAPRALPGRLGVSYLDGSGWLDLNKPRDLRNGDRIRLKVGGSADQVVVRFLSQGESPDDPVGIDGTAVVPGDRIINYTLTQDHPSTVRISVHGSHNPWGEFDLGEANGPASLLSVTLLP